MEWMYYDPKNSAYLERLKKSSGFSDLPLLEKLVLDFEMHYRLKDRFEMVVRGGMAALLHAGPSLQRISEDIDVMTTVPKSQITSIMGTMGTTDKEMEISIEGEPTRLPDHLVHCKIRCSSSTFEDYCTAKVDILCGIDPTLLQYAIKMRSPRLETLELEHDMDIMSRGALIADKMCTLTSAETIGLRNLKNFPKQTHDVAMLLRASSVEDLQTLFRAYGHLASFMLRTHRQTCSVQDLMGGAHDRCMSVLDFGEDTLLSPEYRRHYARFQSRYVRSRKTHRETHHVDEILLSALCARHLREHLADADMEGHAREFHETVHKYMRAREDEDVRTPNPAALARLTGEHPNLANPGAMLTHAQWILLREALAPERG